MFHVSVITWLAIINGFIRHFEALILGFQLFIVFQAMIIDRNSEQLHRVEATNHKPRCVGKIQ